MTLMMLRNALLTDGSDIILSSEGAVFDKAKRTTSEKTIYHDSNLVGLNLSSGFLEVKESPVAGSVNRAYSMLGVYAGHWGHFLYERLPALFAVLPFLAEDTVILIPEGLNQVQLALLQTILKSHNKSNRFCIVKKNHSVRVGELFYSSFPVLLTNDMRWVSMYDYVVQWFGHIVWREMLKWICVSSNGPRKVFITRDARLSRSADNMGAVESFFRTQGYYIFRPEEHDYNSLRMTLGACETLVGVYGSALGNAIFCGSIKKAVFFAPFVRCVEQIFENLNQPVDFEYYPVGAMDQTTHPKLRIDVEKLKSYGF